MNLCINCKHHFYRQGSIWRNCRRLPSTINPVDGSFEPALLGCREERSKDGGYIIPKAKNDFCGPEGKYFEPAIPPQVDQSVQFKAAEAQAPKEDRRWFSYIRGFFT
jgi:hypothetical protein